MLSRPPHRSSTPAARRIGMLSTYPPKLCGLATFAAALEGGLRRAGNSVSVVRIDDGDDIGEAMPSVVATLVNGQPASVHNAAAELSRCDVAIIQHEYGIFGGPDGGEVIDLLDAVEVPVIVVLHTVPLHPTRNQRDVLAAVCERATAVVVMSQAASDRLIDLYPVDERNITTIAHGAATPGPDQLDITRVDERAPQLLTWGLLGPGKGIEHCIDAVALLGDLRPHYTIAGVTHPKVFARDGDGYRQSLINRADDAGVADSVVFDDTYRDVGQLTRFVASATVVVLPYDSRDQVTSGVLVDAVAAGRPVISTAFPHAVEMLGTGAGIVVPHADPAALADALRAVLTSPALLESMAMRARDLAPSLSWSSVAREYADLAELVIRTPDRIIETIAI
jgi:polysaccharide biosynthesis protein PslF